jgi:ribokinase
MKRGVHDKSGRVVVLGSLNIDLIATVDCLPRPGQTVAASALVRRFGGKGANQALASLRQGAETHLIGCLGDDPHGSEYREYLTGAGLGISGVDIVPDQPTGTAMIAVSADAENLIVVAAGANAAMNERRVQAQADLIAGAAGLLLQWEVPLPALATAIAIANGAGVPVFFNPSPLQRGFPWKQVSIEVLIVNEGEAQELFGSSLELHAPEFWSEQLREHGTEWLVITRGARPTWCISKDRSIETATLPVDPIDTVGAGDAFAGALAARLGHGEDLESAVAAANAAGALATLKQGAQEAIPTRAETDAALGRLIT